MGFKKLTKNYRGRKKGDVFKTKFNPKTKTKDMLRSQLRSQLITPEEWYKTHDDHVPIPKLLADLRWKKTPLGKQWEEAWVDNCQNYGATIGDGADWEFYQKFGVWADPEASWWKKRDRYYWTEWAKAVDRAGGEEDETPHDENGYLNEHWGEHPD